MTVDDLLAVKGVSDPQISPDGSLVVYVVSELDRATDKTNSSLWLVPTAGGEPKQLTTAPGTNNHPRWSPDGKIDRLRLQSRRLGPGLAPADRRRRGPPAHQAADRRLRARSGRPRETRSPSPPRSTPGMTPEQTAAKDKEKEASKSKVRTSIA